MPLPFLKRGIFKVSPTNSKIMYEAFIEFLNQIYWEGYAEQLAQENPESFQIEYNEFFNNYQS